MAQDFITENLQFDAQKSGSLNGIDHSRKGSIDQPIQTLVTAINESQDFFTTSSCSGRLILYSLPSADDTAECKKKKPGCIWHFVSHEYPENSDEFFAVLQKAKIECPSIQLTLKFEPFILHVQCRRITSAKRFHTCAMDCGYRNSGLTLGKSGKVTVAVRSTLALEVPLGLAGDSLVSEEYLRYLLMHVVRDKFEANMRGIEKFSYALKKIL